MLNFKKYILICLYYLLPSLLILAIVPFLGNESFSLQDVISFLRQPSVEGKIFFTLRFPQAILAFLVGGALASCGAVLQVVLKNSLADPFVLGISGVGSLGAAAAIAIPGLFFSFGPFSSIQFFCLTGCLLWVTCIYLLTRLPRINISDILLAGVTVNILCAALIMLIRYLVSPYVIVSLDRWMMGGIDTIGYYDIYKFLLFFIPGFGLLVKNSYALNLLGFGPEMAASRGLDPDMVYRQTLFAVGIIVSGSVSIAGPIGFVGLIIPHAVRYFSGHDNRIVVMASFFSGGIFLVLCDLICRVLIFPSQIPLGIITATLGGPAFLFILFKKRGV